MIVPGSFEVWFRNRMERGFTLIEMMVAMTVFAVVFGLIGGSLITAMQLRADADRLTKAVFLARQELNTLKTRFRPENKEGRFESFPGFTYKTTIREETIDPFGTAKELFPSNDPAFQFLQKTGQAQKTNTGLQLRMLHYTVTIYYDEKSYQLDYYKGTGISQ